MSKFNVWMSVSDLMTVLMIIFLFVAISYMVQVKDNQSIIYEYLETKEKLHDKLVDEFAKDTTKWQMSIGKDLTIQFDNPTILFESGKWELTPSFKNVLNDFLPRYFDILLKDSLRTKIQEVRIEGHTDDVHIPSLHNDSYVANIILSQQRALSVVKYFRELPIFEQYSKEEQNLIEYWLTATGFSYGKSLDDNGKYTFITKGNINKVLSRRVEIRIVTNGDKIIEEGVLGKNKKDS